MSICLRSVLLLILLSFVACTNSPSGSRSESPEDLPGSVTTHVTDTVDFSPLFDSLDGCFVLLDDSSGAYTHYNPVRCSTRFIPASTFKIPNSMIALETGVAPDTTFSQEWDSTVAPRQEGWPKSWPQRHTLGSAFRNSVVWFYREIARRVGEKRMQEYVNKFDYGNRSIGGGIDRFWLDGDIRISADEQVRFLHRMFNNELGVSQRSVDAVREFMLIDSGSGWRFGGKTGTADIAPDKTLNWLVGYVEQEGHRWYYALNVEGKEGGGWSAMQRKEKVRQMLDMLGVLAYQHDDL